MNKADWLTADELEAIAAAVRVVGDIDQRVIGLDMIPVVDTNGEALGAIEIVGGEARFVPNLWREDQ